MKITTSEKVKVKTQEFKLPCLVISPNGSIVLLSRKMSKDIDQYMGIVIHAAPEDEVFSSFTGMETELILDSTVCLYTGRILIENSKEVCDVSGAELGV